MAICPKCNKQELKPGENLCPHCKEKKKQRLGRGGCYFTRSTSGSLSSGEKSKTIVLQL